MDKHLLIERSIDLLLEKGIIIDDLKEDVSLTLGGSHASGLSTMQSDIDIRSIKLIGERDILSLHPFEHNKFAEGKGGINGLGDLDIEIYSSLKFLKDLFHGEIVPNEILATDEGSILIEPEWMKDIRNNLLLFKSKKFLFKSLGYFKGARNQATPDEKVMSKIKSGYRLDRIHTYGYDTKNAERSIRILQTIEEYINNEHFTLRRSNADWLKSVRKGVLSKSEYELLIDELYEDVKTKVDNWDFRREPNENEVNDFIYEFHKKWVNN